MSHGPVLVHKYESEMAWNTLVFLQLKFWNEDEDTSENVAEKVMTIKRLHLSAEMVENCSLGWLCV